MVDYNVSPNHLYFKQPSSKLIHGLTQSDLQKLKELNTTHFRSIKLRFFKSQHDQKIQRQANQIKAKITQIKTQMEEEMKKQTSIVGKIEQLKITLKNILSVQPQGQADYKIFNRISNNQRNIKVYDYDQKYIQRKNL